MWCLHQRSRISVGFCAAHGKRVRNLRLSQYCRSERRSAVPGSIVFAHQHRCVDAVIHQSCQTQKSTPVPRRRDRLYLPRGECGIYAGRRVQAAPQNVVGFGVDSHLVKMALYCCVKCPVLLTPSLARRPKFQPLKNRTFANSPSFREGFPAPKFVCALSCGILSCPSASSSFEVVVMRSEVF
jgi:hypothetical protein